MGIIKLENGVILRILKENYEVGYLDFKFFCFRYCVIDNDFVLLVVFFFFIVDCIFWFFWSLVGLYD